MKVNKKFYWKHFRFLVVLTILSIIVCWWGWHVSKPCDGMPFARSGAVATAVLIAFLVSDYAKRLGQVKPDVMDAFTKSGNWTGKSSEIRKGLEADIDKLVARTNTIIRYWYATLMFFATVIWGLGDYFYALVLHDPVLTMYEIASKLIYFGGQ